MSFQTNNLWPQMNILWTHFRILWPQFSSLYCVHLFSRHKLAFCAHKSVFWGGGGGWWCWMLDFFSNQKSKLIVGINYKPFATILYCGRTNFYLREQLIILFYESHVHRILNIVKVWGLFDFRKFGSLFMITAGHSKMEEHE